MNTNPTTTRSFTSTRRIDQRWPSGPWDYEPDEVHWIDLETLLPCVASRAPQGYWRISVAFDREAQVQVQRDLWKYGSVRTANVFVVPYNQIGLEDLHAHREWRWVNINFDSPYDFNPRFNTPRAGRYPLGDHTSYVSFGKAYDEATALARFVHDVQHDVVTTNTYRMWEVMTYGAAAVLFSFIAAMVYFNNQPY